MDSQYNVESTEKTTTTTSSSGDVGLDKIYMKSIDSILKIAEMVLSLIVFICVSFHSYHGGGWVQFVSISCLITVLILWIFFMLRIIYKLPGPWMLIILIYYVVYCVFYLISFLVCAIQAGNNGQNGGFIAAAVFCVFILVVLGADIFFQFRKWQDSGSSFSARSTTSSPGGAATTTTTHTTYETRTQY
ncbi:plasmolipin-like [Mytilus trossulus]|uniref:plasmolipin-like n=1 Tax=Mytilus trossulus TaxID=6551 RepID=UPI0030060B38